MIEAVIMPRFATGVRAALLTCRYPPTQQLSLIDDKSGWWVCKASIGTGRGARSRGWSSEIRWLGIAR